MNSPCRVDLVVSHNREASDAVLRIVDSVEGQGYFAWADVNAFYSPLVSAEKQIARAFSRARVICLFVGNKYRDTRWCQEEYGLGLRAEEDLSIERVITVHHGDYGGAPIPSCLLSRPSFSFTDAGCRGIVDFLSTLPDHSAVLAQWSNGDSAARGDLLGRLPVCERTKLIVEHVDFLNKHFAIGHFDLGGERYALRLGLIGTPPSKTPSHLSPASLMELAWHWALEVLGEVNVRSIVASPMHAEESVVDAEAVMPFLQLPALFFQYLTTARERRKPPINTEAELIAVVDYQLCGFSLLCARAGIDVSESFRGANKLLTLLRKFCPMYLALPSTCAHKYLRSHFPRIL